MFFNGDPKRIALCLGSPQYDQKGIEPLKLLQYLCKIISIQSIKSDYKVSIYLIFPKKHTKSIISTKYFNQVWKQNWQIIKSECLLYGNNVIFVRAHEWHSKIINV